MEMMLVELMRPRGIGDCLRGSRVEFQEGVWYKLTCEISSILPSF
jgi:hypothetical protein